MRGALGCVAVGGAELGRPGEVEEIEVEVLGWGRGALRLGNCGEALWSRDAGLGARVAAESGKG